MLFYGYATGVLSSRRLEASTKQSLPFIFIAGGLHPDHDPLAAFRNTFLPEITRLLIQGLLIAEAAGVLQRGRSSLDGTQRPADASQRRAVSDKRLLELEVPLSAEVEQVLKRAERADQGEPLAPGGGSRRPWGSARSLWPAGPKPRR